MEDLELQKEISKFGHKISLFTSVLTIFTFAIAGMTPPLSGSFCKADCFQYPFTDIISRFPRDYYWMYFAIILSFFYLMMMLSIHQSTKPQKKFSA